jgi:phosphoribosylformimino-5-aminoimidazole carboxamide ribotide isomerase
MIIYPAIDLLNGKCVRLYKGDYNDVTEYSDDPVAVALRFKSLGATHIHIVDLNGAKDNDSVNFEYIKAIYLACGLLIQTGGGIRTMDRIEKLITSGVDRVVLGTAAVKDISFTEKAVKEYKNHIVIGIDARNGHVSTDGWTQDSGIDAVVFGKKMAAIGAVSAVYTDISRDGTLEGPNIEGLTRMIRETGLDIIASGGIKDMNDIHEVRKAGAYAVITGKAIYEGKIDPKILFKEG